MGVENDFQMKINDMINRYVNKNKDENVHQIRQRE